MSEKIEINSPRPESNRKEDVPASFATATIAIIGLGLIGGSLALALKGKCRKLLGIDRDPLIVKQALDQGLVVQADINPAALLPQASMVIIAVPVRSSLELIKTLPRLHPGAAMVMDVGSTKAAVMQVMASLPARFDPLGGHPICGKETGGLGNAERGLFQKATFALVALERTSFHARAMAETLVRLIGAEPLWMEADQHDRWLAATSHLPHLLATALALSTPLECAPLAGPGFRSTSRLAAGSAEMKSDIFATNREAVLEALRRYTQQLDILSTIIAQGDLQGMQRMLALGAECRQTLLEGSDGTPR
jgi:prephenate dehydrogenase